MRSTRMSFALALGFGLLTPAAAHAGPFNIDPATGQITAASGTLSFEFVSRSAAYTHNFGLYSTSHVLISPIFSAPNPDTPGVVANIVVTPGTSFLFGLQVVENGYTWFSDGTSNPWNPYQSLKFKFTNIDEFTTLIEMEDLMNFAGLNICHGNGIIEKCDYNDMVVKVTNMDLPDVNTTVPEPATMVLLATGLVGLGGMNLARRRRRS